MNNTEVIENIDIEQIMDEIRAKIKERGYTEDMLKFRDVAVDMNVSMDVFSPEVFGKVVEQTNANSHINYYEIPIGTGIKGFVKKCIRKMISFAVPPVVMQVNEYNRSATQSINQIHAFIKKYESDMKEKDRQIAELKKRIEKLEKNG